ncbi:class I SAM-dependent methyltransferase [Methylobacterium mesophilicum SR1.6/6]|uniref:Class I SAM-dependent methyltransferase n=1 Tax=Methylobacterium mesophilicum SR1.6/6 TaxID=908290 RepID=A0A6B9FS56_9HYPH|nr:class I SAM-dependent methyltransferase [Methylobacterium mesophilicum]QGY05513.1 class I SAM-dependent methyltransferase [Methylobacterium mesophilicum SR1.6/6]
MDELAHHSLGKTNNFELITLLDEVYDAINGLDGNRLYLLLDKMNDFRPSLESNKDISDIQDIVRAHKSFALLMQDPYSYHAFNKPRGFPGDASLIDLFYGHGAGRQTITEQGRFIFETFMRSPSCDAIRFRRGYYGAFLDRIASERSGRAQALALACGHLREALFSRAVTEDTIRIVGADSDVLAVNEATRSLIGRNVEIRHRSIIDFIRNRSWRETYDFIYAAGLFDYLDDRVARKVISVAFEALNPGGSISFANFLPSIRERGYMDIVMDWRLIYRTKNDMLALTSKLPQESIASIDVWIDPLDTVVYLTATKRG